MIVGIASIVLSIVLFVASFFIQEFSRTRLGADFFPRVTAIILFLLGIILVVRDVKSARSAAPSESATPPIKMVGFAGPWAIIANILLFIAYLLLLNKIGYLILTPLYLFCQILLLTNPAKYRFGWYAILSIAVGFITYYGFAILFQVYLPAGLMR